MAGGTVARHTAVVETGTPPIRGGVAVITLIIALNMIWRFAIGPHIVMTRFTELRRTDEKTIEVTTVTLHVSVPAGQRETGGEMIEFADCRIRALALKTTSQQHQQNEKQFHDTGVS